MSFIQRGFWVGASIVFSAIASVLLTVLGSQIGILKGFAGSPNLFCMPAFGLKVPTVSLVVARDQLNSPGKRVGFWLSSFALSGLGLLGVQIAAPLYAIYHQNFEFSTGITMLATLVVGFIFGLSQWLWFLQRARHKLKWIFGPIFCWFVPALPFLMFPPRFEG